jgi:hypothetical protein
MKGNNSVEKVTGFRWRRTRPRTNFKTFTLKTKNRRPQQQSIAANSHTKHKPLGVLKVVNCKLLIIAVVVISTPHADPVPDPAFRYVVQKPAYRKDGGPIVMIDEAHFNHHTSTGRYLPFADLLRDDGYVVQSSTRLFSQDMLKRGNILVIANALHKSNANY